MSSRSLKSRDQLLKTQKKIYHSLKTEAEQLMGKTPAPIVAYEREYQKDFRGIAETSTNRLKSVGKKKLIKEIRSSDVTLIADYHTFAQAQRTALRIIRDAIRPGEEWWIGVEMVASHFQAQLDLFQAGKISLDEFHDMIDYRSEWGFPWQHYQPLFDWAREHGVRLIALNRPKELFYPFSNSARALTDLRKRDEWAAGIITDLFAARKGRMIILYGELHVGRTHLPEEIKKISKHFLKKPLSCISIHQNNDNFFWKLAQAGHSIETLKIGPSGYCVFSSTPWAKQQSLVTWAESFSSPSDDSTDDAGADSDISEIDSEFEADYHHWIATYSDFLSEIFQVALPEIETATIKTVDEVEFVDEVSKKQKYSALENKVLKFHIENNIRTFIPYSEILYLASPTSNGAAELAGIHLFRKMSGYPYFFKPGTEDFYRRVIESMFGFFSSLLINPKRKCDLPGDHARRIQTLRTQKGTAVTIERNARELALLFFKSRSPERLDLLVRLKLRGGTDRQLSGVLAAHYIGRILARKLNQALLQDEISLEQVKAWVLKRVSGADRFHAKQVQRVFSAVGTQEIESSKQDKL